jgi:phosphoesterase family protein
MQTHPRSVLSVLGLALAAGLLIASSASASVNVTVSKPANGATVPLTFNVQASATTTNTGAVVTGWHIYVDGADKYGTAGPTNSINTNVTTAAGTHTVIVRAWDSTGDFGDQTLTLDASSAAVLVNVSTPANNATVPLTFNVQASATTSNSGAVVTGWHIYVDSADKYGTSGPTSSINTNVTTTEGTHTVLVRAWDSTGASGDKTLTVNATPGVLVNVSTPTNGANVPLTFNVTASASTSNSGAVVTGWHIYLDSADVYGTSGPTSSINVNVTASTSGTHTLLVRAWDSTGAFGDKTLTINTGGTGGGGGVSGHHHVVVVAFENHSYETVVGSSSAPYFNSLISSYGLATNNYANGHDSLSQYWWMMDGTSNCGGSVCNSDPTNTVATADSIIREVINSGNSWKQYTEALPFRGDLVETTSSGITTSQGTYYSRHSPAIFLSDVRQGVAGNSNNSSTYCSGEPNGYDSTKQACNVVNFADANNGFIADLNASRLPNFSLIIPNGCDDAHDCSFSTTDSWMQTNIGALLNTSYFKPGGDGLLILWFDEGSLSGFTAACGTTAHGDNRSTSTNCSGGGGRTAVVVVAPDLKSPNYKSSVYYQHPSVTHTVCNALGISTPAPASSATDFTDFFQ